MTISSNYQLAWCYCLTSSPQVSKLLWLPSFWRRRRPQLLRGWLPLHLRESQLLVLPKMYLQRSKQKYCNNIHCIYTDTSDYLLYFSDKKFGQDLQMSEITQEAKLKYGGWSKFNVRKHYKFEETGININTNKFKIVHDKEPGGVSALLASRTCYKYSMETYMYRNLVIRSKLIIKFSMPSISRVSSVM